jgi:hypothetical protein
MPPALARVIETSAIFMTLADISHAILHIANKLTFSPLRPLRLCGGKFNRKGARNAKFRKRKTTNQWRGTVYNRVYFFP